jgi:hypothetical protein
LFTATLAIIRLSGYIQCCRWQGCNVILIRYQFDAPDAHLDYLHLSLFSGTQAEKVGNPKTIVKTVKELIKPKYYAMKLSQIRRRIELCMREIILRFEMN